ncbi:MAG: crotonase/enoyl-CoA hydratase family protein [Acidimicrobiales bacterium]
MANLTYDLADGIATITIDDGKANALTPGLLAELHAAVARAEADGAVLLVAGRPGRFSGGFDLPTLTAFTTDSADLLKAGFDLSHRLLSFPRPVVVACTGHAIAMGAFLLLSADHRVGVAGGGHKIGATEVAIGMAMPWAAVEVLRQRLARAHFERATLLAEVFTPEGAVEAGFLDELVPEAELHDHARRVATRLAGLDAKAHAVTKVRARSAMLESLARAIARDDGEFRAAIAQQATS